MSTDLNTFKQYEIIGNLSWYEPSLSIYHFKYTLSQYTPSAYAQILFTIPNKELEKFKKIELLSILDREVKLEFVPELYRLSGNKAYFSGPYKFIVLNYEVLDIPKHVQIVPGTDRDVNMGKLIILNCVDKVFYSMTIDKKYKSYRNMLSSDVAKKIIQENGGKVKQVDDTNYRYTWLQPQLTDYKMMRSLLPYSQTPDNKTLYTFFTLNEECYFTYVGAGKVEKMSLAIDDMLTFKQTNTAKDLKLLIEKFGLKDMKIAHHGFSNFNTYQPIDIELLAGESNKAEWKQHQSQGAMYLTNVIEDETLIKNYINNLRHRIHTFSRILSISSSAIPDLLPIDTIKLSHVVRGEDKALGGLYYIGAITYNYPGTSGTSAAYHITPKMKILLLSELDAFSNKVKEGDTIR